MEHAIKKLIRPHEREAIFTNGQPKEEGVEIGEFQELDPEIIDSFFSLMCPRIDKLLEYDMELNNGSLSNLGQKALSIRGFTFAEFQDLFSSHISEAEFPFYPVFGQLKKRGKVGIDTLKERDDFISKYENEDLQKSYLQAICENSHPSYHEFFFEWMKYSALLPLRFLRQHMWIVGSTGSGKTWLLTLIAYRLIQKYKKFSFILIDVHGDISKVLKRHRQFAKNPDRLVYINPFFKEGYAPTFNFFELGSTSLKDKIHLVENLITAFEECLERDESRRTEVQVNYLEKCLYFLIERKNSNIKHLKDLLACEPEIFEEAKNYEPTFFNAAYAKPTNKTRTALAERVSRLLNSPILEQMFEGASTFDLEASMNSGKVLLFDLADLSDSTAKIFGKFLISSIKAIVKKRRKNDFPCPTFLMLDEAHVLMSGTFEYILEQLRGFGLSCILSHQYPNQLKSQKETVQQNCAVRIVGGFDDPENINAVTKIPKATRPLKDYEFYLKVRHRRIEIFKTPAKFVTKRKKYEMTDKQEKEIDRMQLEKYYRVVGQSDKEKQREPFSPKEEAVSQAPKPLFQLDIKSKDVHSI